MILCKFHLLLFQPLVSKPDTHRQAYVVAIAAFARSSHVTGMKKYHDVNP